MNSLRRAAKIVGVSALIAGAAVLGFNTYQQHEAANRRHDAQCAPSRQQATEHEQAIARMAAAAQQTPAPGGTVDFQQVVDASLARIQQDTAETAAYFHVIDTSPECFSKQQVSTARAWLRQQERRDSDVQSYWYCWDSGETQPHHLGHHVPDDHLCTWGELRAAGMAGQ